MAIEIMTQVWRCGPRRKDPAYIMLALADHADEVGECYPSIALLQQKARMSKSTVLRVLKLLTEEGWLTVRHRSVEAEDGRARGNLYCINMERLGLANPGRKTVRRLPAEANKRAPRSVTETPHEKLALEANKRAPRGVTQTPHEETVRCQEESVRCQETVREVSGVKSPPAPPLVGEPSEPSQTPPTPLERGADGATGRIAELQARLKATPRGSREYFAIAFELHPLLHGEEAKASPQATATQGPPAGATMGELVVWLMATCGFSEEGRRRPILAPALRGVLALADPADQPGRAAAMASVWQRYAQGPTRWGPAKFFLEGHWQHPRSWPPEGRVFDPCVTRPGAAIGAMA
jgi:hypothetical protein